MRTTPLHRVRAERLRLVAAQGRRPAFRPASAEAAECGSPRGLGTFHHDERLVAELWATGFILDPGDLPGGVEVIFVLDLPAEQLPWGVTPPVLRSLVAGHRLDNKPIVVHARPLGRSVCTVGLPRAVRVWSAEGADEDQLSALSDPASHSMEVASIADVDPSDLDQEREISRRFLVDAVANYWDREWRREHRGSRRTPELMLWEAVRGYFQLTGDIDTHGPSD